MDVVAEFEAALDAEEQAYVDRLEADVRAREARGLEFNPDQPRDEQGRWTDEGGTSGAVDSTAITATPQFKQWFGDSKVVEADGQPKVVYHSGDFDETRGEAPTVGPEGFHFGTKTAAEMRPSGKMVDDTIKGMTVEQDEESGKWFWRFDDGRESSDLDESGFDSEEDARQDGERTAAEEAENTDWGVFEEPPVTQAYLRITNPMRVRDQKGDWTAAVKKAKRLGYDGLVYRNEYEDKGSTSYVVFDAKQIKSIRATMFDPNNALITMQARINPLQRAADSRLKDMAVAVRYALALARAEADTGDPDHIATVIADALVDVMPAALLRAVRAGGEAGLKLLPSLRTAEARALAPKLTMRFDAGNARAALWAEEHAAELAKDISETTRQAIKDAMADALDEGEDPYEAILAAIGDEERADLIARTETMIAANEGQREGWRQAVEEGLLTGKERRVWIATADACDECAELDGSKAELDGDYGDGVTGPPLHPRCRCTEGLA